MGAVRCLSGCRSIRAPRSDLRLPAREWFAVVIIAGFPREIWGFDKGEQAVLFLEGSPYEGRRRQTGSGSERLILLASRFFEN